ncbi:MAG TPA: kelch repeat-containing protein [Candidatus Sulfotelmatobacter sp.]
MKRTLLLLFTVGLGASLLAAKDHPKIANMPAAVTSNAVAELKGGLELFSIMGMGPRKTWDDVTNRVFIFSLATGKWREGRAVPGVAGRLGAAAIGAKGKVFVFGGYVVDKQGEITVSDVNGYVPEAHKWYRGADIPVPVDNSVIGVNHDRYIYLVGGRSKNGPVNNVQVYDAEKNTWSVGTPFPGTPVFGNAGALADDTIVSLDGAKKNSEGEAPYVASDEAWMGKIDHKDPNKIEWSKLPAHPGPARFGIAGGADGHKIWFTGGSASPHDFRGMGYDGQPAEPAAVTFVFDLRANRWDTVNEAEQDSRMDCRGVLGTPAGPIILGGMTKGQEVTARGTLLVRK